MAPEAETRTTEAALKTETVPGSGNENSGSGIRNGSGSGSGNENSGIGTENGSGSGNESENSDSGSGSSTSNSDSHSDAGSTTASISVRDRARLMTAPVASGSTADGDHTAEDKPDANEEETEEPDGETAGDKGTKEQAAAGRRYAGESL